MTSLMVAEDLLEKLVEMVVELHRTNHDSLGLPRVVDPDDASLVRLARAFIGRKTGRPDWDKYFLQIAEVVATRATCDRKHVGAVIVSAGHQILSTGYNGAPAGMPSCDEIGHEMKDMGGRQSCVRTVHAEMNAIAQAAKNGVSVYGGHIYTTASPCYDCGKAIVNAGITRVVFAEPYQSRYGMSGDVAEFLVKAKVNVQGPGVPRKVEGT